MQYNQPYGISDPNAPYINGNPSTGTMGSIPPAASIEYDQREIVEVIKWAADHGYKDMYNALCQPPTNADLQQLLKALFGIMNSSRLTVPATYYVNGTTGDDSYNGLTPATAYKTINRAVYQSTVYNLNGFSVTIRVADGTYGPVGLPPVNGSGWVILIGNTTNPVNCKIHANKGPAVHCVGGPYAMDGFRLESDINDPPNGLPGNGVWVHPPGQIDVGMTGGQMEFGNCYDAHMGATGGSLAYNGDIRIAGNARYHLHASSRSWVFPTGVPGPRLIGLSAFNFTKFIGADMVSSMTAHWPLGQSGVSGFTGMKFSVVQNAVINSGGVGINGLPGNVAGEQLQGGLYV